MRRGRVNSFFYIFCDKQHPHHSSLKEEVSDVVRQKKKYLKKPKIECVVTPQQPSEPLPAISKSDIKQYDFHSSDEEEFLQVLNALLQISAYTGEISAASNWASLA